MSSRTPQNPRTSKPELSDAQAARLRRKLAVMRGALALAWAVAVVAFWPAIPRFFGSFMLCFLLTNALWSFLPLARASVMAFALTGLAAIAGELALASADFVAVPVLWLVDAFGAALGGVVGYFGMPIIDKLFNPAR